MNTDPKFANKKVLVTGATGFIGSWLTQGLIGRGAKVRAVVREGERTDRLKGFKNDLEIVSGDLKDPAFSRNIAEGCDMAFHLAALKKNASFYSQHPAMVLSENVAITVNFFEAMHRSNVKKILFISSSRIGPEWLGSSHFGYAWAKKVGEVFAEAFRREYSLDTVVARVENTFGPRDNFEPEGAQVIPSLIRRIVLEKEMPLRVSANPDAKNSFCYVEDVTQALISLLSDEKSPLVSRVSHSYSVSFREIIDCIMRVSGITLPVEFSHQKFSGGEEEPSSLPIFEIKPLYSFEEAIRRTISYFKENNRIS